MSMARWIAALALALAHVLVAGCSPTPVYRSQPGSASTSPRKAQPSGDRNRDKKPPPVVRPAVPAHPVDPESISTDKAYQIGIASYYGKKFHGRKTANGETFNMYKLSAAHRVLPLGTVVKVTHLEKGRWVVVKVNDRGPYIEGRILDLSFAAALELEMVQQGTARVMIEIVEAVE